MGLKIAAACLIGMVSVAIGVVPALARKAPVAKRSTVAKWAAAAKAPAVPLSPEDAFLAKNRKLRGVIQTASGVQYRVIKPATGAHPTDTDIALVNYEGKLLDGKTFDKSQQPTPMPIRGVVPGFSEALKLMSKGAKYHVWIPAKLGYGEKGAGPIPANATLAFDIELIDFLPQAVIEQYQRQMQQMNGGAGGMFPDIVPGSVSIVQAASPAISQTFM